MAKANHEVANKLREINSGREGITMLDIPSDEIEGSLYMGNLKYAARVDGMIFIYHYDPINEEIKKIGINGDELNVLLRI